MRCYLRILVLTLLPFSFLCTDRERSNPLDPKNPVTKGRVSGVQVYSQEHRVTIRWDRLKMDGLQAILIYRKAIADSGFTRVGTTSSSYFYVDSINTYGIDYEYYVTALIAGYESPPSQHVHIVPGPTYTWVADVSSGYLTRLTHDLQYHVFDFGILSFPCLVAVSPQERSAWVYSKFSESIYKVNRIGHPDVELRQYQHLTHMAVDTLTHELWFSISEQGSLILLDSLGHQKMAIKDIHRPSRLAVDSRHHACYAIDRASRDIFKVSGDGWVMNRLQGSISPQDIVFMPLAQTLWVADSTRLVVYDLSGSPTGLEINNFFFASLVAYDNVRDMCWLVDLEPVGQNATLVKISGDGRIQFELAKFLHPTSIAVNEFDGSCMVADIGAANLYRVSGDGKEVTVVGEYYAPYAVAVEHH
jgi:hypothetical protein